MSATLAAMLFAGDAQAELQFNPSLVEYGINGAKMHRLRFIEAAKQVTYTPPQGWTYSGSTNVLTLRPPAAIDGEASISRMPVVNEQHFDAETVKQLTSEVVRSLPNGATNITLVGVENEPVTIEHKPTLLIVVEFEFYGNWEQRSVLFLNRRQDQIRFQLTCPRNNFAQLQKAFLTSHFSWQNL